MAELIVLVGATASFAQIFDAIIKVSSAIEHFCHDIKDAPSEISRIGAKLTLISVSLRSFQQHLQDFENDEILPSDFRLSLQAAIRLVAEVITDIERESCITDIADSKTFKRRFKWATSEKRTIKRLLERLGNAEDTLTCLLQLLTLSVFQLLYHLPLTKICHSRILSVACVSVQQSANKIGMFQDLFSCSQFSSPNIDGILTTIPQNGRSPGRTSAIKSLRCSILEIDHWLRQLGFIGSVTRITTIDDRHNTRISIGYKLPTWISTKVFSVEMHWSYLERHLNEISILPGYIRVQNQVRSDSPFMIACKASDVRLIRQCLENGSGCVRDRTICSSKTPLLVCSQVTFVCGLLRLDYS